MTLETNQTPDSGSVPSALTIERTVIDCERCGFYRETDATDRRKSAIIGGHAHGRCPEEPDVTTELILVCDSCGYQHGQEGAEVSVVSETDPYPERTLCGVCREHRDALRIESAFGVLFD